MDNAEGIDSADDLPLPDDFYIFVTSDNPTMLWNIEHIGNISSSAFAAYGSIPEFRAQYDAGEDDWLPFVPNPKFQHFLSSQSLRTTSNYRAEYHAECVRQRSFRQAPSRLSAVFAWGSLDEARQAAGQPGGRYKNRPLKRCVFWNNPCVLPASIAKSSLSLERWRQRAQQPKN
jgi:hypothetical protein